MGGRYIIDEDPLAKLLAPPPDETPEQRAVRLQLEAEARQVSERIDEQIKAERAALKKSKPVKVLLLGQSESGPYPSPRAVLPHLTSLSPGLFRKVDNA